MRASQAISAAPHRSFSVPQQRSDSSHPSVFSGPVSTVWGTVSGTYFDGRCRVNPQSRAPTAPSVPTSSPTVSSRCRSRQLTCPPQPSAPRPHVQSNLRQGRLNATAPEVAVSRLAHHMKLKHSRPQAGSSPPEVSAPSSHWNSSCAYSTTISIKERTSSLQFLKSSSSSVAGFSRITAASKAWIND